jgi:hypothetical protein
MADFNKDYLLGDLVPRTFINKVTLETKNKVISNTNRDNPHIVEASLSATDNAFSTEPSLGNIGGVSVVDGTLGNLSQVAKSLAPPSLPATPSTLSTVQLIVKETINNDTLSTFWFGQNDVFQDLIKIKLIQSTNKKLTDFINNNPSLLNEEPSKTLENKLAGQKFIKGVDFVEEGIDLTSYHNVDGNDVTKELEKFYKTVDSDGNTIYDIPFTKEFEIKNPNIEHLAYFVFSYLDINSISQDIGLDAGDLLSEFEMTGIITSDIVINNFRIVSTSRIFLDPDDKIWVGPVHKMSDGRYMTGGEHMEESVDLQLRFVPNTKIQDFRIVRRGQKQIIDISQLEEDFINKKSELKQSASQQLDIIKKKPYLSDVFISKDKSGNARLLFCVDYFNLIRENAVFGKLLDAKNQNIYSFTRIASLKILRKRISRENGIDKLGSPIRQGSDFDTNMPIESIIESGEKSYGQFSTRETDGGNLQEIMLGGTDSRIRTFSVMDKSISSITDGFYIYGVELELEDNTSEYLLGMLGDLIDSNEILKEYYTIANIPKDDFYNVKNDIFAQGFVNYIKSQYGSTPPNIPAITAYENFLKLPTPENKSGALTEEQKEILKMLINISSPDTGNRQGILLLLDAMENAIGAIESLLDIYNNARPKTNLNFPSTGKDKVDSKITTPTIKIINFFNNQSFDSDIEKNVGYEYISFDDSKTNQVGLRSISFSGYSSRTDQEILKYFNSTALENVNTKTKYAYFSPQQVLLSEPFSNFVLKSNKSNDDYSLLESMVLSYNSSQSPLNQFQTAGTVTTKLAAEAVKYRNNMKGFFAKIGITVTSVVEADPTPTYQRFKSGLSFDVSSLNSTPLNANPIDPSSNYTGELNTDFKVDNQNPNVLFRSLSKIFVESGKVNANSTDDPFVEDKQVGQYQVAANKTVETNTITIFDENNQDGIVLLMEEYPLYRKSISINNGFFIDPNTIEEAQGAPQATRRSAGSVVSQLGLGVSPPPGTEGVAETISNKTSEQVVETFPNQIKSIFLARSSSNLVKDVTFFADDVLRSASKLAKFNFNYNMLKKIEVLEGFQIINGKVQITSGKWELLTIEGYNKLRSKYILCRMVDYNNKPIGIYPKKGIVLPTINEYFMIAPVSGAPIVPPSRGLTRPRQLIQQARSGVSDAERSSQEILIQELNQPPRTRQVQEQTTFRQQEPQPQISAPILIPSEGLTRATRLIQQARSGVTDAEAASQKIPLKELQQSTALGEQVKQQTAFQQQQAGSTAQSPIQIQTPNQQSFTENYLSRIKSEGVDNAVKMVSTSNAPSKVVPQNVASNDLSNDPQTINTIRNFSI